jgi:hypothetical protein
MDPERNIESFVVDLVDKMDLSTLKGANESES